MVQKARTDIAAMVGALKMYKLDNYTVFQPLIRG